MVWKLVLAIVLIAAVVEGNRWPCEKAKAKLDTCRENGFVIGDCKVGDGKMNDRKRRRCEKMESKYADKCGDYECEQGNYNLLHLIFNNFLVLLVSGYSDFLLWHFNGCDDIGVLIWIYGHGLYLGAFLFVMRIYLP